MFESGQVDGQASLDPNVDYSKGVYRSIVPPDHIFVAEKLLDELTLSVHEIKLNTHKLAIRQKEKIQQFKDVKKWKIHELDKHQAHEGKVKKAHRRMAKLSDLIQVSKLLMTS
ncbi:hypothetical protein Leryth_026684 [Lithospermum erythrorhizon]|nr:hypothetical protein Leryth_026684 [Lithospermum erythrorhizon]